jgi:hypothetical protein
VAGGGSVQRAVGPVFVVMLAEPIELPLQGGEVGCRGAGSEPALQGLVEALDLALGLRVSGRSVLLLDTEDRQQVLERVATSPGTGLCRPGRCR